MARRSVKLQETRRDFAPDAKVIDASFTVVKKPGGGILKRAFQYALIVVGVAVIGFLIPPMAILAVEMLRDD